MAWIVDAFWHVGVVVAFLAAREADGRLTRSATPHRVVRSWALWGGVGALSASLFWVASAHGFDSALAAGLVGALLGRPLGLAVAGLIDLLEDYTRYSEARDGEWHAAWRRRRRSPEPWTPVATSVPAEADPEPDLKPASPYVRWAHLTLTVALWLGWPAVTILADLARDGPRTELIVAEIEAMGFEEPRVWRTLTSAPCWGGAEFDWRAGAGDGRACVRDGDAVTVLVERDRTTDDPFTRPAQ